MKKNLSIIVPVYNVEKYLEKCILSIYNSSIYEFTYEIIVVNDGSTDSSSYILENLKKIISNLIIIYQKNKGLSEARNKGLEFATGKYVWFIDSDDYINDIFFDYNELFESSNDLIFFDFNIVVENGYLNSKLEKGNNYRKYFYEGCYNNIDFYKKFSRNHGLMYAWGYFIKLEFILKNKLYFLSGIHYEDIEFTTKAIFLANNISIKKIALYNYLQRQGSILASAKPKKFHYDHAKITSSLNDFYTQNSEIISPLFKIEIRKSLLRTLLDLSYYKKKDIINFSKNLKEIRINNYESFVWNILIFMMQRNILLSVSLIKSIRYIMNLLK